MIGPQGVDLDVFYTLPTALGEEWDFEYLALERERFTLELLATVDRTHAVRNAVVVVAPAQADFMRHVRLGLAHAWREGVRRFVLLFAGTSEPSPAQTDEVEQELRVMLDEIGDGGAAPTVRSALTRCAGNATHLAPAMLRLLDEIERVFPPDDEAAAVVDAPPPASFGAEAAILDAIAPLIRAGTMLGRHGAFLEETAALRDGSGGSHRKGWPYLPLDEPWPTCPRCKREIPCHMQFDMRDALHAPPPSHALYVIYRCDNCYSPDNVVIRHYDAPSAANRRPIDLAAPHADDHEIYVMKRVAQMLPESEIVEADHPEVIRALLDIDPNWGRLYWWAESALGMSSPRIPDHLGGWQVSQYASVPTCACDAKLHLVSSTEAGDYRESIWACPIHPDLTQYVFHK